MEDRERGHLYPLLIVKDRFEPAQVLLLERHQDHECAGFVMQLRVVGSRLGVEEPHGGLVPHVVLIASHWGIIQPDKGTAAMENIRRCLTAVEIWIPANEVAERPKNRHRLFTICQHLVQKKKIQSETPDTPECSKRKPKWITSDFGTEKPPLKKSRGLNVILSFATCPLQHKIANPQSAKGLEGVKWAL